ncbi:peptidylprolyl isomerase [Psychroflexus aestuariivivens]|uniref:peptidylprolyl isomerase n=1 Tax=Psychroflexus aestuariivivens TaxID=1795040 RepID=UPI000FDCAA65|nr:peptidylprolyl isomerase [Psychroflexus aestuariivivens]
MAILSKIRERTVFLIVIIALALFAFVLTDLFKNGGFTSDKTTNTIGVVGDEEITREEFAAQVENIVQQNRGRVTTMQAAKQAWDGKLRQMLLKQEYDKLGLEVGAEQITDAMADQLAGDPRFSDENGFFSEAKLKQFIAEAKVTNPQQYQQWINFEQNMEVMAKSQLYFNMIKAGISATLLEGEQIYHQENDNLSFEFVRVGFDQVDDVEISKSDINQYISQHKDRFKQEEKRDLEYVYFEEEPSEEDEMRVEASISNLLKDTESEEFEGKTNFKTTDNVEEFVAIHSETPYKDQYVFEYNMKGEFDQDILKLDVNDVYGPYKENEQLKITKLLERTKKPDSVKTSHILITYDGTRIDPEVTRTKEEAEKLADSILNVVKGNSDKFAEIAEEMSSDKQSATKGGDLGWINYGALVPEFNDYVFEEGKVNDYGLVETDYGFHVVFIEDRTEPKDAVKIATVTKSIEPSEKTLNNLYREASKFELSAKDEGFTETAETADKEIKPVRGINKLDESIPGIGRQRQIVRWAFEEETKVGDIKSFEIDNGYVVARITNKIAEGVQTAEEASSKVTPILKNEKRAEKIIGRIGDKNLDEVATEFGVSKQTAAAVNMSNPTIPGGGREPKVVGAAFALEVGEQSNPIEGNKGVYILKLTEKNKAPELPSYRGVAKEETKTRTQSLNSRNSNVIDALKESREIEDNRHLIY